MKEKDKNRKKICRKSIKIFKPRKKSGALLCVQDEKIQEFFKLKNTVLESENNKLTIAVKFLKKTKLKAIEIIEKFHSAKNFQQFSFKKGLGVLGQQAVQKETVWIRGKESIASARRIDWFFFRRFLLKEGAALITILAVLAAVYVQNSPHSQGATYTWIQTDWSGGLDGGTYPNHTNNQSGWTKYSAKDSTINIGSDLTLSLATTSDTTVNFTTESAYIQEDSTSGTDFSSGKATLHSAAPTDAVPEMTSNTTPSGTVSASSYYSTYYPWQAFAVGGNWITQFTPVFPEWLQYQFTSAKTITGYTVRCYDVNQGPSTWTLRGSNNGTDWTVLDSRSGVTWSSSAEIKTYSFSNSTAYVYYQINITAATSGASYFGIPDLELLLYSYPISQAYYITTSSGSQIDTVGWGQITGITTTETTPSDTSIKYLVSFDGKTSWKYWTGSAWATSSLSNLQTEGMSKTALEAITQNQWNSGGGFQSGATATLDFAMDLASTNAAISSELDQITVNHQIIFNSDSSLNFTTEGNYTQEDATNGTDFIGGAAYLHANGIQTFGGGEDGACTVSGSKNINTDINVCTERTRTYADAVNFSVTQNTSSGQNQITLSSAPDGLSVGDEILIINLQGTSGDNSNAGQYESEIISSINSNTLTFTQNLTNSYNGTTQKIMVQRVPHYTDVTISSGATLAASAWNGTKGGVVFFRASGTLANSGTINMSDKGYRGGSGGPGTDGTQGESYGGTGAVAHTPNLGGGSGGQHCNESTGGAGGSYGTQGGQGLRDEGCPCSGGSNTEPGATYGAADLSSKIYLGSGGGGGVKYVNSYGIAASGGNGGGIIMINAGTLATSGGSVTNSGTIGQDSTHNYSGNGGSGAGGSISIVSNSATLGTAKVTASGAAAQTGTSGNGDGGAGGTGRIAVYATSVSGTTSPSAYNSSTLPTSISYPTTPYFITTASNSQINTSSWGSITGVTTTQTTPANTSIKYLVSFDNRITWKYWTGSAWTASSLDNLQTNGMSSTTLQALSSSNWSASGGFQAGATATLDFAADLSTSDSLVTPKLDQISITYITPYTLTSSAFNTQSSTNILGSIRWTETLPSGTDIKFQIQTAPDNSGSPGSWSGWMGPNGTDSSYFTDPAGGESMPAALTSGGNDQWVQYKIYFSTTNAANTPTLSDITLTYVVNASPAFDATFGTNGVNISQISDSGDVNWGKVQIQYKIKDTDTTSGTVTPNFVTPTFEYSLNGGSSWAAVSAGTMSFGAAPSGGQITDINSDSIMDNKVLEGSYLTYTAYWDAKSQIPGNYSASFQIRVTIDDNEAANATVAAIGNTVTLDVKNPVLGAHPILVAATSTPAGLTFSASDDSSLQMKISLDSNFSGASWQSYNSTSTIALATDPDMVYVIYRDAYGNQSATSTVSTPETPTAMMVQDTSNINASPDEYRLFVAWKTVAEPTAGFARYNILRSTNNITFNSLATIDSRATNYYGDNSVAFNTDYYYKISTQDSDGNTSYLSSVVYGKANGIQDAGEGGGGSESTPPTISSVVSSGITTTSATITWNTDELSNSTVGYSTTQGVFTNETGNASMVDDSGGVGAHQVVLTGLSPNTTYYYRVKSTDASSNIATDSNGGNGYSFATLPGPAISDVNVVQIDNTQVKINWTTNTNSNTYIVYSTSSSLSNPTEIGSLSMVGGSNPYQHSYTLTGLTADTTYYFYAKSVDGGGNIAIDNNGRNYYQFTTASDNYAPSLSGIEASLVTDEEAVIQWTTNEPATSQVKYSTTSGGPYTNSIVTSLMDRSHYIILSGLDVDETYYYKVVSSDINGNQTISTEYSFETIQDAEYQHDPLSKISDVSDPPSIVTDEKAVITFDTDQPANCTVEYGTQSGNYSEVPVAESDYNENHSIHLSGLILATTYYYQLTCEDNLENVASSDEYSFTTLSEEEDEKDSTAPSISNVKSSSTTGELAIITWETDENANSLVRYGTTTDYGSMAGNDLINIDSGEYIKDHTVTINNLIPSTKYYYTVISTDASGNISESADYSFTTKSPSTLSSIKAVSASLNEAIVTWITDKAMNSIVEYGLTNEYGEAKSSETKVKDHEIALSGLKSSNTYHFRVKGKDDNNNLYSSADYTFEPKSPPKISGSKVESVSEHGAKIIITTNIPTDVLITYTDTRNFQNSGSQGKPELATNHTVELKNLDPGTNYNLKIKVRDEEGNETEEESKSFTTSRDENPPQIDQVRTDMALTQLDKVQAIISWVTDEPATTLFIYKEKAQGDEKEIVINENLTLSHTTVITTFKPGTVYYFKAKSVDQNKNEAVSKEFAMLTPRKKENVVQIIINNFQDIFRWARF